jgi:hypothetical protein
VSVAPEVLVTVAEVAARLHKSKRWLQEFLREKPFGRSAGRTRLFTEEDIAAIIDSLPRASCSKQVESSSVAVPSEAALWRKAQALLKRPRTRSHH